MTQFILASQSPRRKELLSELGYSFDTCPADVEEIPAKREKPRDYVSRVAQDKAIKIAGENVGKVVLASDTDVVIGRQILGKPENADECAKMMRLLSGKRHKVISGVCVVDKNGKIHEEIVETIIKFKSLSEPDIKTYASDASNWEGVAGGYRIQSAKGMALVKWIRGSQSSVIGLPLVETQNLLKRCGI